MTGLGPEVEAAIAEVREDVARLHAELVRYELVAWTAGNVSGRVPGADLFVIKPSGVSYDDLSAEAMIVCDLDGQVVPGTAGSERAPSSDTAAHAYVYRHLPEVGGVVHTHSTYAVAWAARGEEIPCVITGMADEFGGPIPVGPFAVIGDDSIGRGIVETLRGHRSRAVLMRNHGPFTIGVTPRDAVKAAVMVEDVARTVHIARQGGPLVPIPQDAVDRSTSATSTSTGRPPTTVASPQPGLLRPGSETRHGTRSARDRLDGLEVWFVTGSQTLYGEETLRQVAEQSQQIAAGLADLPVRVVWKPVLTEPGRHPPAGARGERPRRGGRPDRLDAHLQPREDVDRRARRAAQAAAAPAHPGERRAAVGGDRLRLHEPQPGGARRP